MEGEGTGLSSLGTTRPPIPTKPVGRTLEGRFKYELMSPEFKLPSIGPRLQIWFTVNHAVKEKYDNGPLANLHAVCLRIS